MTERRTPDSDSTAFRPPRGLSNRHIQTLLPALGLVKNPRPAFCRELLELPDGDSLAADWFGEIELPADAPLLVVLHGLEGSSESSYARGLCDEAARRGWLSVVMHFRDCGDHRNRLARRYHAGETGDIEIFLEHVQRVHPGRPLFIAGFSLGGNALLKYLGENRDAAPVTAAAAVSVPFELAKANDAISQGFSKFYRWHLMKNMRRALRRKFKAEEAPFDFERAMRAKDFRTFDDAATAPLHGFRDVEHYYDSQSCRQYLGDIRRPTLIVHAIDDPFMSPDMIPESSELPECVSLQLTDHGGHVGFVTRSQGRLTSWLPKRLTEYLAQAL